VLDHLVTAIAQVALGPVDDAGRMRLARRSPDGGIDRPRWRASALAGAAIGAVTSNLVRLLIPRGRARDVVGGQRLERGFDDAAIGMAMLTPSLEILQVNKATCRLFARAPGQLVGRSILEFIHPEDADRSTHKAPRGRHANTRAPVVERYVRPDGSIVEASVTTALIQPHRGDPYVFSQLQDVTERQRAEHQKAVIGDLGQRAVECTDVMALMSEAMQIARASLGATSCTIVRRLAGGEIRVVAMDGDAPEIAIPPGHPSQTAYTLLGSDPVICNDLPGETRFSTPVTLINSGLFRSLSVPVLQRAGARHVILGHRTRGEPQFTVEDGHFLKAIAHVIAGALERAETEDELRRRALEDPLTGLANRALLTTQLEAELRHARRLGHRVCLLGLDLDRFKVINDTLGHTAGDMLLRQVAARLTSCVREEDLIARPGGDEFIVVCTRTASDHAIAEVAQRLVDSLIEPFDVEGREVYVSASAGLAVSEHGGSTPEELLRDADAAMYRAKELGGCRFEAFDPTLRQRLVERMAIENDLRHAVERQQLELHYQPMIDLVKERVVGFEALIRWQHPERGLMMPDEFIHIAEETGLIVQLGSWVLSAACAQMTRWPQRIQLSVNLSPAQIRPELVTEVERLLSRHGIPPQRLVLEITESLVLDPSIKSVVASLRALGVQLALDDFGTGYSSLGSLQRFPLDVVKLDRTLIESVAEGRGVAIVRAAVELGRALGVEVIAEGIEAPGQLSALRDLGCPLGQGFLFARPLPLAEAERLLQAFPWRPGPARGVAA
jgi:diguanylate cyclase (GGDEF)-like protein/PAS domain S-box-containing protein